MTTEPAPLIPVTQPGSMIEAARHLTPDEWQQAQDIAASLDVRDSMAITGFGVKPQKEMSALADPILKLVATKDAGAAGETLGELMLEVRAADADSLAGLVEPALARLPGIGSMFSKVQRFRSRYEKIGAKIDRIVVGLEKAKYVLSRDVALLDRFYEQNNGYVRSLLVYIAAGESKLDELRNDLARLQDDVAASSDPLQAQAVSDLSDAIARLERRVHDLKLATMVALQTAPQIRLVQNGNQALVEKIQSSIVTTIPLWKNQIILALTMLHQDRALGVQRRVTDTTQEILEANARRLRQGTTEVAREAERGIVEIETLRRVNGDLIGTIEDALRIQEEGRRRRLEAEGQLAELQKELAAALSQSRAAKAQ